jgi:hypothetical protein
VPAAAVIPAPIAYVKVAAVKKLVVEFRNVFITATPLGVCWMIDFYFSVMPTSPFTWNVKCSE